jgi:GDPmannose 4,6-dehydratase
MKTAIIIGCLGQDGSILYKFLLRKQYQLIGIDVNHYQSNFKSLNKIVNISNKKEVNRLVRTSKPSEIYFLAAYHHSSEDKIDISNSELFQKSFQVNVDLLVYFLDAILKYSPQTKLFYAASSHIFGDTERDYDDENSCIDPVTIYGISKATGLFMCRHYRKQYSIFASCGIFYNHESTLRTDNYISKKIIKGVINIKNKNQEKLVVGDLSAEADWGYAPDYIDAIYKILSLDRPDDYIIATGKKHSVSEFARLAFHCIGLDSQHYLREEKNLIKRKPVCRVGKSTKLNNDTGWEPSINFKEMVRVLLANEGAFD